MASQPQLIHPLQHRLADLRREVRRLVVVRGVAAVAVSMLAVVIALGGIDYWIRFQDRGVLAIFSLAALMVFIVTAYRYLYIPSRSSWSDTDLALRVQEHLPVLSDRLASAVEFLRQTEDDPLAGSAEMRRAVIAQATAACEQIEFKQVLDARPVQRWAMAALAMALFAGLLVLANPAASAIAMQRLALPLGSVAWPRISHLGLRQPVLPIGRGQAFVVEVVDQRGERLPDDIKIAYRPLAASGKTSEDVERMTVVGDVATARREQVSQSFQFRIQGGDSEPIGWTTVSVLEPPEILALKIHRDVPAYAHIGASDDDSPLSLSVLAGTRLSLSATASKPIVAASLVREGKPDLPVTLVEATNDRRASRLLHVDFIADQSTSFAFKLLDLDKLNGGGGQRWDLHVVADAPPKAVIDQPSGNLSVTSSAVVPIVVIASDDLSLQTVTLRASAVVAKNKIENNRLLYAASSDLTASQTSAGPSIGPILRPTLGPSLGPDKSDQRSLNTLFDVAQFAPHIEAGSQVILVAVATDFLPQTGTSEPRTLTVISQEELLERMAARQNLLAAELARILKIQQDAREQVRLEQIRLRETGALSQAEVDRLQVCELNERDVDRSLSRRGDGATSHIVALLADLAINRVDNPVLKKRLQDLLDEIDRLQREHLPLLAQALTAAVKSAQVALDPDGAAVRGHPIESSLDTTLQHQQAVIESLEAMLARLRQWDDFQRFHRDISRLLRDQDELAKNTKAMGSNTLTKELKDLTSNELAELKVLAERQNELARQLDRLEEEMGRASEVLRPHDAKAADALTDAQAESRKAAIAASMRQASDDLAANHIGHVTEDQTNLAENLRSLLDILGGTSDDSLARRVKKLGDARREMGLLRKDQQDARQTIDASGHEADPTQRRSGLEKARRDQDKSQTATKDLARRLRRLSAADAANKTSEAADQMRNSSEDAGKGNAEQATQHAKAAEKALGEAVQSVDQALSQARSELHFEKMASLEVSLKLLYAKELRLLEATREFERLQKAEPHIAAQMSDAQISGLHDLAQEQADVRDEVGRAAATFEPETIFRLALSTACDDLALAATALARNNTGQSAQNPEQRAIDQLARILEAVKPESPAKKTGGDASPENRAPSKQLATLADLKLLHSLQEELNRRTKSLGEASAGGKISSEEVQAQFNRLTEEQGRLAALALKFLTNEKPAAADNDPPLDNPKKGDKP